MVNLFNFLNSNEVSHMKYFITLLFILSSISFYLSGQTVNGRLQVVTNNGTTFVVKLQINSNTAGNRLGTSTVQFTFNNLALSYPTGGGPQNGVHYTYHNYGASPYTSHVTQPVVGKVSANIVLLSSDNGTVIAQSPAWTDVCSFTFGITNSAALNSSAFTMLEVFSDAAFPVQFTNGTWEGLTDVPLPVEMKTFAATISGNAVQLNWETTTEVNCFGFDIERSLSTSEQYTKVGFIQGSGNSNSVKKYEFSDVPEQQGLYNYRLKQIDNDGSIAYYGPVLVDFSQTPDNYALYQNFPNPFNPSTLISFDIPCESHVSLEIFNTVGEKVASPVSHYLSSGKHTVSFSAADLPTGLYFYVLRADEFTSVKKMMILK